jgi:hypothetical protein
MGGMRKFRVSGKNITVYVYSDPDAVESILVGPDHVIVIASRDLTEEEANSRIDGYGIFDIKPRCSICGRRHYYYRMGTGPDGLINTVCGSCDPSVKFAIAYFEAIDRLFA